MQAARKPNSVLDDHSSRRSITAPLEQPTRRFRSKLHSPGRDGPSRARRLSGRDETPCLFGLAPCGVYRAAAVTTRAVGSYPTVSPLPLAACAGEFGGLFSVALAVQLACASRPGRYPAHCPAEFGLSSPARHVCPRTRRERQRSPGRLHRIECSRPCIGNRPRAAVFQDCSARCPG